jgi:hypothetical protein
MVQKAIDQTEQYIKGRINAAREQITFHKIQLEVSQDILDQIERFKRSEEEAVKREVDAQARKE